MSQHPTVGSPTRASFFFSNNENYEHRKLLLLKKKLVLAKKRHHRAILVHPLNAQSAREEHRVSNRLYFHLTLYPLKFNHYFQLTPSQFAFSFPSAPMHRTDTQTVPDTPDARRKLHGTPSYRRQPISTSSSSQNPHILQWRVPWA